MRKTALFMLLVFVLALSCKKTVESEKKSWENNLKIVNALVYDYPSFSTVIKEHIAAAENKMRETESVSDEKDKIKRMAEVNGFLKSGFIRNLEEISVLKKSIRSKSVEVRGLNVDFTERRSLEQAVFYAEGAIVKSEEKLKQQVTNKTEAEALSSSVYSDLKSAQADLDRLIDSVRAKQKKAEKKVEQEKTAKEQAEKQKIEAAKPIICKYCSTPNEPKAKVCKSCGSPLK